MNHPRVFISYAREDGEDFAAQLRSRLEEEEPEITLWQDRVKMVGGVNWRLQIAAVLERVEFLVLVMTPAALASETTRWEWQTARHHGASVFPVKVPDNPVDFARMPRWMAKVHFYDLDQEWQTFVNYLKSPPQSLRVPFMPPELPANYVPRVAAIEEVLSYLLGIEDQEKTGTTVALHGPGGFGKTVLATAVCRDDRIIWGFEDGILWTTLGEKPDLKSQLSKLYTQLTGERLDFEDADDAGACFKKKLNGRNCLLVIDDVWDGQDLLPFVAGAIGCTRLITTRRFDVAAAQHAHCKVLEMSDDEAVNLLKRFLPPPAGHPLVPLAKKLDGWPLLLQLAGAQLRTEFARPGATLGDALAYVQGLLLGGGITIFDASDPKQRDKAVSATMEAGLRRLSDEDRDACLELSILPEDYSIPLAMAAALWGYGELETRQTAGRLMDLSLIELRVDTATMRMHDVVRKYLAGQLPQHPRLDSMLTRLPEVLAVEDSESFRVALHKSLNGHFGRYGNWPERLRRSLDKSRHGFVKVFLAELLDMEGEHDKALSVCEEMLDDPTLQGSWSTSVKIMIALYLQHMNEHARSLEVLSDAIRDCDQVSDSVDLRCRALYHTGIAQSRLQKFASSVATLTQVHNTALRRGIRSSARHQLGVVYLALGDSRDLGRVESWFREGDSGCPVATSSTNFRQAYAPRRLGQVHALRGDFNQAMKEFERSAEVSRHFGNRRHWVLALRDETLFIRVPCYVIDRAQNDCRLQELKSKFEPGLRSRLQGWSPEHEPAPREFEISDADLSHSFRVIYNHEDRTRTRNAFLDVFDWYRRVPSGTVVRWQLAHTVGHWHGVVAVLLVHKDPGEMQSEILIQRRTEHDSHGKWDVSVGGHIEVGDSPQLTAAREAYEEVGLILDTDPKRLVRIGELFGFWKVGAPEIKEDVHLKAGGFLYPKSERNCELMSVFVARAERDQQGRLTSHRPERLPETDWLTIAAAHKEVRSHNTEYASAIRQIFGSTENCRLVDNAIANL